VKRLEVTLGKFYSFVRGYESRKLLVSVGSRPQWSPLNQAWAASREYGLAASELAEHRGWIVSVVDETLPTGHGRDQLAPSLEAQPEDVALW